jgi:hypothetical protein
MDHSHHRAIRLLAVQPFLGGAIWDSSMGLGQFGEALLFVADSLFRVGGERWSGGEINQIFASASIRWRFATRGVCVVELTFIGSVADSSDTSVLP